MRDDFQSLGIAVIIVLYTCLWTSAWTDLEEWIQTADLSDSPVSAGKMCWLICCALLTSWIWLLLLVLSLILAQTYVLSHLRVGTSRNGTPVAISFGVLATGPVVSTIVACIIATAIFIWINALRATARPSKGNNAPTTRDAVHNAMTFNLVLVITSLVLTRLFSPLQATPTGGLQMKKARGRG